MAPVFDTDTPILIPDRVDYHGRLKWVLWPALQYRVVTPLVRDPSVNPFQRAILGLARAGLREIAETASLLGLAVEFAELVRDELRTLRYLDEFGAITGQGLAALDDGFLDPQQVVVTHVYQDPFTEVLWPAAVSSPLLVGARWSSRERAELELASAGNSKPVSALAVPVPRSTAFTTPASDDIIEAVSLASQAGGTGEGEWHRRAPERVASRVSLVTAGQPVYLPVPIVLWTEKGDDGNDGPTSWMAFSPFSGRSSQMLRHLIVARTDAFPPLRRTVERVMDRPLEAFFAEFERLSDQVQKLYGERIEQWFGSSVREHGRLVELLTVLDSNWRLAQRPGPQSSPMEIAATAAWKIQELLLRQIATAAPAAFSASVKEGPEVRRKLLNACLKINLESQEYSRLGRPSRDRIKGVFTKPDDKKVPELLAALVVAAAQHGRSHPFHIMASRRRHLLSDLTAAAAIRNKGAHGDQSPIHIEQLALSRRLAIESTATFLGVPVPDIDLTTD